MLVSFIRTVILYILIIFTIRITGKRQIGQLSPTEFVIALLISQLAVLPMEDMQKPLLVGVLPILSLVALEFFISVLNLKSIGIRRLFNGSSVPIIEKGNINQQNMKKVKLTLDELTEELRIKGTFDLSEVEAAFMETNGQISVLLKEECSPVTNKPQKADVPTVVICDGKIINQGLEKAGISLETLKKEIKSQGFSEAKEIFYATVDSEKSFYFIKKEL